MPLSVFPDERRSLPTSRASGNGAEDGGAHTAPHYIAWVAADPFGGGFKVVITGRSFQRETRFADYDDLDVIREGVKPTIEDDGWDI